MPTIHVVGSLNHDLIVSVPRHGRPGETVLATGAVAMAGGKGLNQAIAARRLSRGEEGAVRMIGRVGDDAFGHGLIKTLASEGIDAAGVVAVPGAMTGIGVVCVAPSGENAITVISGANHLWGTSPAMTLTARDIVLAQMEIPAAVTLAAFETARAAHATTILNLAPFAPPSDALLAATDVLVVNEIECAHLSGRPLEEVRSKAVVEIARDLTERGPRAVIVTLGAAGALLVEAGGRAARSPGLGLKAVDTAGAGDCFVGALAAALRRDETLPAAATFANRAAGVSVTRAGTSAAMPRLEDLG
jgi:ribokinase